jgi:iron complex outermembrane receptor protein
MPSLVRHALVVWLLCGAQASAQTVASAGSAQDLKRLTIEQLAEIDVTTASRRSERLSQTAAAVSVITEEDIRRSGVTRLGEAMRLGDAVDVARTDGRTWAVTARGFNISTANKLLVLMDGRTLYSPLFSGTFWDVQDAVLLDIDRIEVIRGPGGAIWGANAVNGVVNIITKRAADTRGAAVTLGVGDENELVASARYGGRAGAQGSYRVYGKYRQHDANVFASGAEAGDPMKFGQGGVRLESGDAAASSWFVQGDLYRGTEGLFDRDDTDVAGGNMLGRWTRRFSSTSEFQAQVYYDATYRNIPQQFREMRHTIDVDTQHQTTVRTRHNLIVGGAFRVTRGEDIGIAGFFFDPERRTSTLFSAFAQDEITLQPGRVFLTLGSKFERNDFTGLEVQPTARLRWSPGARQTVWGAVSRAVRLPTRFDTDLRLVNPITRAVVLSGSEDFDAESVVAVEGGYRVRPWPRLSLDVAAFRNRYDNLRSQERPARAGEPVLLANMLNAATSGGELAGTLQLHGRWRLHGSYAYLRKSLSFDEGSRDLTRGASEGNDPRHVAHLRSYVDLPAGLTFDAFVRHVGERPAPVVPAYTELDVRLAWIARPGLELSLVGRNLLHDQHREFGPTGALQYEFERRVFLRTAWRF